MQIIQPRRLHPWKTIWVLAVLIALFIYLTRRDTPGPKHPSWTGKTMGTLYTIKLADSQFTTKQLDAVKSEVDALLRELNRQMSHYQPDSELSQFNRSPSTAPFKVSEPFARVTRFAVELCRRSGGAFDPSIEPLINHWGFGPAGRAENPPTKDEISILLATTGCGHLRVTEANELQKDIPELHLNLSAVAKGFGSDEVARAILARGASNVFVEVGGEVAAFGFNAQGKPWRIGIDTPEPHLLPGESIEAVVQLSGKAIATSGDYRNYVEDEHGNRLSHILDPRTGYPIRHNVASVSVVANDCMTADALATTLFVMGAEDGMRFIEAWADAEALFLIKEADGSFRQAASSGFSQFTQPGN